MILSSHGNASQSPTFRATVDDLNQQIQIIPSRNVLYDNYTPSGGQPYQPPAPSSPITTTTFSDAHSDISQTQSAQILVALQKTKLLDQNSWVVPSFNSSIDLGSVLASVGLSAAQVGEVRQTMFASMGTLVLFRNVSPVNAQILPVRNQPGWLVFDNGDESFLLEIPDISVNGTRRVPVQSKIDEAMAVRRPQLSPESLAAANLPLPSAAFTALQVHGLVDEQGVVKDPRLVTPEVLGAVLADQHYDGNQVNVVQDLMLATPYVVLGKDAFVSPTITQDVSARVYDRLNAYQLIDNSSRVNLPLVNAPVIAAALQGLAGLEPAQIPRIFRTLVGMPRTVEAAYLDAGDPALTGRYNDVHDYTFALTRTSTAAVDTLSRKLFIGGVGEMLSLPSQQIPPVPVLPFARFAPNTNAITLPSAIDGAQVDFTGVYGGYYWEVFYHIPMLVAGTLSTNQQFAQAQNWFQYVFAPTSKEAFVTPEVLAASSQRIITSAQATQIISGLQGLHIGTPEAPVLDTNGRVNPAFSATTDLSSLNFDDPRQGPIVTNVLLNYRMTTPHNHYWRFQSFRNYTLQTLLQVLTDPDQIETYNRYPFDPHAIARLRLGAYEKATVMQYVQNLIDWGDYEFTKDTNELIVAATMLYVYAYDLLGSRPMDLGPRPPRQPMTFDQIRTEYKSGAGIPQFLIDLEQMLPSDPLPPRQRADDRGVFNNLNAYFGVPENDELTTYWDTIDDRLHKIRSSMNIKGQVRILPLYAPEINPMDLIRAAQSGANFLAGSAGTGQAPAPVFRFSTLIERAKALTALLSDLGGKLLAALEKRDAEDIAVLRNTQEGQLLALTTFTKQKQIEDLTNTLASLNVSLQSATARQTYYTTLIGDWINAGEQTAMASSMAALEFHVVATALEAASAIAYSVPQAGSPFAMTYGGQQLGHVLSASASKAKVGAEISDYIAQLALTMAGYTRRRDEWTFSQAQAAYDIQNIQQQIAATQARIDLRIRNLRCTRRRLSRTLRLSAIWHRSSPTPIFISGWWRESRQCTSRLISSP